jgi:hypothetical protein
MSVPTARLGKHSATFQKRHTIATCMRKPAPSRNGGSAEKIRGSLRAGVLFVVFIRVDSVVGKTPGAG